MSKGMASIDYYKTDRGVYSATNVQRITWNITGSGSGAVTGSVDGEQCTTKEIGGMVKRVAVFPNKTLNPTDDFDIYLYDLSASRDGTLRNYGSLDLLKGAGVDTGNSAPTQICLASEPLIAGKISLVARNMGALKKAIVVVYIK